MKIYIASSWRNTIQPSIVKELRNIGHEIYDFRHPTERNDGFSWSEIDPNWENWTPEVFRVALKTAPAEEGFALDFAAMQWADACVMVQPCGRSAAVELGWFVGAGKPAIVLLAPGQEPELMLKMASALCVNMDEVKTALKELV